jgi:hypothetical protein
MLLKLRLVCGDNSARVSDVELLPVWTQYRDVTGAARLRVLPAYGALLDYENENRLLLTQSDYRRLLKVHDEASKLAQKNGASRAMIKRAYAVVV